MVYEVNKHAWICCECNQEMFSADDVKTKCTRIYGSGPNRIECEHQRCEKCKPDDFRLYQSEGDYIYPKDHFCPDAIIFNSKHDPKEIREMFEEKKRTENPRGPHTTLTQEIWNNLQPMMRLIEEVMSETCVELGDHGAERNIECVHHRNQKREKEAFYATVNRSVETVAEGIGQMQVQGLARTASRGSKTKKHHRTVGKFVKDHMKGHGKHGKKHRKDKDNDGQGGASSSTAA